MNHSVTETQIRALTASEIEAVSGGPIPLAIAVAIVAASAAGAYTVAKDVAQTKNAEDANSSSSGGECGCN